MTAGLLTLVAGAVAAYGLWRWLSSGGYRYEDEQEHRIRSQAWVLVVLPLTAGLLVVSLCSRWPLGVAMGYAVALVPLTALAAIDIDVRRLPDRLTLPFAGVAALVVAGASAATGDWSEALRALLAGLALAAAFFVLLIASPGGAGLGFGDVKLAIGLGMLLGWFCWAIVLAGAFLGFLTASVWGLWLIVTRRATRTSAIAFGPFLVLGTWLAVLVA